MPVAVLVAALHGAGAAAATAAQAPSGGGAEDASRGVLERLIGEWEGEGELFGRSAGFSMRWSWTLDERFVELSFENRLVPPDGPATPVLRARAFYTTTPPLRGSWFDTRGETLELSATTSDSTLVTEWASATERGRTTYRILGPDALEVTDEVHGESGWRTFGTALYRRVGPGP